MNPSRKFMRVAAAVFTAAVASFFINGAAISAEYLIEIDNFEFVGEDIFLEPGDVVIWINRDIAPHTVTAKDKSWDSGTLKTGEKWQIEITEKMVFDYFCRFHPSMKASLKVN